MVDYLYRCPDGHETTHSASMGDATPHASCHCGQNARRAFTAPMVGGGQRPLHAAMDRAHASADRPDVVRAAPPQGAAPATQTDPRQAHLPRP